MNARARGPTLRAALAILSLAAAFGPAAAAEKETFFATVVMNNNMMLPAGTTYQVKMLVESWTTPEERQRLLGILKQGGQAALMPEMRKLRAGAIVPPPFSRQPSWQINVAASFDTPEGRVIRLFCDRPIAFFEGTYDTRSLDYEIGVFELKLNKEGKGEGLAIQAAKVGFDASGEIVFETPSSSMGPSKLMGVYQYKKKSKKSQKPE